MLLHDEWLVASLMIQCLFREASYTITLSMVRIHFRLHFFFLFLRLDLIDFLRALRFNKVVIILGREVLLLEGLH